MRRTNLWLTPPGGTRAPRRVARTLVTSLIVGILSIGIAWAGAGLVPIGAEKDATKGVGGFVGVQTEEGSTEAPAAAAYSPADLQPGQILAGAAKISLYPRPEDYQGDFPGARWEQDQTKCETLSGNPSSVQEGLKNAADTRVRWHENPNCLYMGGYGIGPMNSITSWDNEYGLWTRAVAMQDSQGDTFVITYIDAVYWEAHYNNMCPKDPCGFLDLADQLAGETGLKPESFLFVSTHSHTSMDFIAGWGGVPRWYMQQATDSLKAAAKGALASMEPAVLEAGETTVRNRNGERRDYYYSAEDDNVAWLRFIDADDQPRPETCTTPTPPPTNSGSGNGFGNAGKQPAPQPVCEPAAPGRAIATLAAYPAHPVTEDEEGGEGDADFPAVFAKRVEEAFGGVGMFLQTGLGNMSPRGNKIEMGNGLAEAVPAIGSGTQITDPNVKVARKLWAQPTTNVPLGHLGAVGVFDRTFNRTPAAVHVGKSGYPNHKCSSASHISVETSVTAAKVGSVLITGGPGELFSNITNTIEERNPNGITMALGLANDGLGYIVQSFETDHVGRQGAGFVGGPLAEYEDAYSIDHCFGDATLQYTIELINQLNA